MKLFFWYFIFVFLFKISDDQIQSLPVCLLPYSSVPGMSFSSPPYIKAVSTVAKQQHRPSMETMESLPASTSKLRRSEITGESFLFKFLG